MTKAMTSIREQIAEELKQVKSTVAPPSGYNVSLKNKQFTLPDGTQSDGPMNCVILDFRSLNLYYTGVYNANNPQPPACFALGKNLETLAPSEGAPEPQNDLCETCQFNQWGSDPNGGKGKACKNTRKLAVIAVDADEKTKPVIITVSPSGIASFDSLVRNLEKNGVLPIQVVTEISFDSTVTYPKLIFGESPTPHDRLDFFWSKREEAQELLDKEPEIRRT